ASNIGRWIGTSEAVPIGNLLHRIDEGSGGAVKRLIVRMIKQGTEEAVQETVSGILNAATAQRLYDPTRGIWTAERGEEAAVGFTTGALLEFLTSLILPGRMRGGRGADTQVEPGDDGSTSTPEQVMADANKAISEA